MDMIETKKAIVNEFLQFKGLRDVAQLDAFINRIEVAMGNGTSPDPDLVYMVATLRAAYEECITSDFLKCKTIAEPIFTWLSNKTDWSFVNIAILQIVICYADTYKLADSLAQKALEMLKHAYAQEKYQQSYTYAIHAGMTFRLLRAKYYDIENPEKQKSQIDKIEDLFNRYLRLSRKMISADTRHIVPMMLNIREALFDNDCEGVIKHLENFRHVADKPTYDSMRNEVIEYLSFLPTLSTSAFRLLSGSRIQKFRKARGKTTAQIAEYVGTTSNVINDIEAGRRGTDPSRIYSMAKFLDVAVESITGHNYDTKPIEPVEVDPFVKEMIRLSKIASPQIKKYVIDMTKRTLKIANLSQDGDSSDSETDSEE